MSLSLVQGLIRRASHEDINLMQTVTMIRKQPLFRQQSIYYYYKIRLTHIQVRKGRLLCANFLMVDNHVH